MTVARMTFRPLRVLDLDIENRPLSYGGQDFTFADVTAVAWSWGADVDLELLMPDQDGIDLSRLLEAWNQADMVTGHNVVKHDLRNLNGRLLEMDLPPLGPKLVQDTYLHLKRRSGVSASQENLASMLGIEAPKVSMTQVDWRTANRLLPSGLWRTRDRVVGDVVQHMALRNRLLELGWLRSPRVWNP